MTSTGGRIVSPWVVDAPEPAMGGNAPDDGRESDDNDTTPLMNSLEGSEKRIPVPRTAPSKGSIPNGSPAPASATGPTPEEVRALYPSLGERICSALGGALAVFTLPFRRGHQQDQQAPQGANVPREAASTGASAAAAPPQTAATRQRKGQSPLALENMSAQERLQRLRNRVKADLEAEAQEVHPGLMNVSRRRRFVEENFEPRLKLAVREEQMQNSTKQARRLERKIRNTQQELENLRTYMKRLNGSLKRAKGAERQQVTLDLSRAISQYKAKQQAIVEARRVRETFMRIIHEEEERVEREAIVSAREYGDYLDQLQGTPNHGQRAKEGMRNYMKTRLAAAKDSKEYHEAIQQQRMIDAELAAEVDEVRRMGLEEEEGPVAGALDEGLSDRDNAFLLSILGEEGEEEGVGVPSPVERVPMGDWLGEEEDEEEGEEFEMGLGRRRVPAAAGGGGRRPA